VIAVSSRHALAVLALAVVAAIPIGWHAIVAPTADPCRDPAALLASEQIGQGRVIEPARPGERGAIHLTGRVEPNPPRVFSMIFRVSRGFEPESYYGLREVASLDHSLPLDTTGEQIALEDGSASLPVLWLEDSIGSNFRVRGHFFVLDGQPVVHPFFAGLARAGSQLTGGTLPVTMFVFRAEGATSESEVMRDQTRAWLRDAWKHYQQVCSR